MTLLEPFMPTSPATVPLVVGVAYALGFHPEFTAAYLGSVAALSLFMNFGTMVALVIILGMIEDRSTRSAPER